MSKTQSMARRNNAAWEGVRQMGTGLHRSAIIVYKEVLISKQKDHHLPKGGGKEGVGQKGRRRGLHQQGRAPCGAEAPGDTSVQ